VQSINLKNIGEWVEEPLEQLIKNEKLFVLNEYVAYNAEDFLLKLLKELMRRAREE